MIYKIFFGVFILTLGVSCASPMSKMHEEGEAQSPAPVSSPENKGVIKEPDNLGTGSKIALALKGLGAVVLGGLGVFGLYQTGKFLLGKKTVGEPPVVDDPAVDEPPVNDPPVDHPPVNDPPVNNPPVVQKIPEEIFEQKLKAARLAATQCNSAQECLNGLQKEILDFLVQPYENTDKGPLLGPYEKLPLGAFVQAYNSELPDFGASQSKEAQVFLQKLLNQILEIGALEERALKALGVFYVLYQYKGLPPIKNFKLEVTADTRKRGLKGWYGVEKDAVGEYYLADILDAIQKDASLEHQFYMLAVIGGNTSLTFALSNIRKAN